MEGFAGHPAILRHQVKPICEGQYDEYQPGISERIDE